MGVSQVNLGTNDSQVYQNKGNYAKTGAKIGAVAGAGIATKNILANKQFIKDIFEKSSKTLGKNASKGAFIAGMATGAGVLMAVGSAIGLGVGSILNGIKNKKE